MPVLESRSMNGYAAGVDLIAIDRIRDVLARHSERFLRRIYTPREIDYCGGRVQELAVRFAAKEAVMKALGTGVRGLAWKEIEILANGRGKPVVHLHHAALARAHRIGLAQMDISLTHESGIACAFVVGGPQIDPGRGRRA